MEDNVEFKEFDKIARLNREVVVTEKIDGTNGLVWVSDDSSIVKAGSRTRWVTPEADNFGFARWVQENVDELRKLGPGYHYGEWWGAGFNAAMASPRNGGRCSTLPSGQTTPCVRSAVTWSPSWRPASA